MENELLKVREWAINKIKTEYPDDVALLVAVEGCAVNGDWHGEVFDYFIPATERGNDLAETFIIGDIGIDLYPRSWERTEHTANLDNQSPQCVGSARILYARSKEDEERFLALKQKFFENLSDPQFVYKKALENLNTAMDLYRTMLFENRLYRVRGLAGYVHRYLTTAVACLNNTYRKDYHGGYHGGVIHEVSQWKALPAHFIEYYQAILTANTTEEMRNLAYLLIAGTREFIAGYKPEENLPEKVKDYQWLADWYQELRDWLRRLYYFCDIKNIDDAFYEACQMQSELDIIGEDFGLGEMDLLGYFQADNLDILHNRASELEKEIIETIESNGVWIKKYANVDEFLAARK